MLEIILLIIPTVLLVVYFGRDLFNEFFKFKKVKIKGPSTIACTIFGCLFSLFSDEDHFHILQKLSKLYPKYYGVWIISKYFFVTDDPRIVQAILQNPKCTEKNILMELFGFSKGLLSLKADKWKPERKLLNHTLSTFVLQNYAKVFNQKVDESLKNLDLMLNKQEFDIEEILSETTMSALLATTFGVPSNEETTKQFVEVTNKLLDAIWSRAMNPFLYSNYLYSFTPMSKREKFYRAFLNDFIMEMTKEKCQEMEENSEKFDSKISFLYQLLNVSDSGRGFTQEEINDHVATILVCGSDSMSCSLGFLFLLLSMHEQVQDKIVQEVRKVFGDSEELKILYENLADLKYIDMVVMECLRLFSPVFGIFREIKSEVDLGTNLAINCYSLNRRKSIWGESADKFDPDRFSPEKLNDSELFSAFVPFGGGIRTCFGHKYALAFMKIIVAHYVQRYRFSTTLKYEDIKLRGGIAVKLVGQHLVSIQKRI